MHLKLSQRYRIIFLHLDTEGPKWGYKKIAREISCDVKTVKYWVQQYNDREDLSDNLTGGPNPKISKSDQNEINKLATSKNLSTRSIAEIMKTRGTQVSTTSVFNYLKLNNLKYQMPLRRRLITENHRNKRLA
jgi:transposase